MLAQLVLRMVLLALGSGTALSTAHASAAATPTPRVSEARGTAESPTHFRLAVDGDVHPYDVFAIFTLPGETVRLTRAEPVDDPSSLEVTATEGVLDATADGVWSWTAPDRPGLEKLEAHDRETDSVIRVNAFVMEPAAAVRGGRLNGYPIGTYPVSGGRQSTAYTPPRGFIRVSQEILDTQVSPHFRIGQFLCKEDAGWPKYLALSPRLVQKLELILAEVNSRGYDVETFHVMSGYRTPAYNHGLGNVKLSRHQYGDAADIFIDRNNDGRMDDLNHDGRVDKGDSRLLYNIIEEMQARPEFARYTGGMGVYDATHTHGPFVHVDARGFRARWEG